MKRAERAEREAARREARELDERWQAEREQELWERFFSLALQGVAAAQGPWGVPTPRGAERVDYSEYLVNRAERVADIATRRVLVRRKANQ